MAANASSGMRSRLERNEPVAHITEEQTTSRSAQSGAPPLGRTRSASPAKPTTTPPIATRGGRSPVAVRMSTIQSGTAPMISAASPVGTWRSATNSTAFAPGSSAPTSTHEASCARVTRSTCAPRRHAVKPAMSSPAARKRVPTANSGGIVSPASLMPRYVEPQIT